MNSKDFLSVFDLLRSHGGKYIIVEEGKPAFVLMKFDEYKKICENNEVKNNFKEELAERINKDIALWHAVQKESEQEAFLPNPSKEDLEYFFKTEDDFEKTEGK